MENIALQFLEVYYNVRPAVKKMVVSMCVHMGVGVCVSVWMRVFKLSQTRNLKRWL